MSLHLFISKNYLFILLLSITKIFINKNYIDIFIQNKDNCYKLNKKRLILLYYF